MDCSPLGSSVHGILQAGILEWAAIPFSRGSCHHRDWTHVSCVAARFFTIWTTREWIKRGNQLPIDIPQQWFSLVRSWAMGEKTWKNYSLSNRYEISVGRWGLQKKDAVLPDLPHNMLWRGFWTLLRTYREEGKLEKTFTNTKNPQDQTLTYTKSPTHRPSSCELSKLWTCVQSLGSIWGVTASFWGAAPKQRTVHKGCSRHSECKSVILCHLWWGKKSHHPDISGLLFYFFFIFIFFLSFF